MRGDLRGDRREELAAKRAKVFVPPLSSLALTSDEDELNSFVDIFFMSLANVTRLSCLEGDGAKVIREVSRNSDPGSPPLLALRMLPEVACNSLISALSVRSCYSIHTKYYFYFNIL